MLKQRRITQKNDYFIPFRKKNSKVRATISQIMYFVQIPKFDAAQT